MNKEDWVKIKEVFNEALDVPLIERHEFLRSKLNGNDEMRFEVERMLAYDDDDSSVDTLETNVFQIYTQIPEKIGDFTIIREIGRGGMGTVYEAVRGNENFSQRAALKVIKRGMDTDAILSRFRYEQKILSSLEHPNIARFLDGGMTADDLPFYAMEFIEGEFIDEYCARRNLPIKERLELFRKVCGAVQYAHQNLIIHRDLKPGNILVTEDGTPKLLDFGIGKILSPDSTDNFQTATQLEMMTPAYASPEQITGKAIGTTSDTYALGVILYELLTGRKPYQINSKSLIEIERAILRDEPQKPSVSIRTIDKSTANAVSPNISSRLRGDLDCIVLKAMRKNPEDRYSSVHEFSEDIWRHLNGVPITARPLTLGYRAGKFFRRNKVSVIAGLLVFLSLCVGTAAALWQASEAHAAKIRAENRFNQVRELANNVIFKYHDSIAELPGSTSAREMLVRDALKYLDNLSAEAGDNPDLQRELGQAYSKLGDVQGKLYAANIGDSAGALDSYLKAVALLEAAVEKQGDEPETKEALIKAYSDLALLQLRTGGPKNGKELVEKALALLQGMNRNQPLDDEKMLLLTELYVRLGDVDVGNTNEGRGQNFEIRLAHHLKALPLAEKLAASGSEDFEKIQTLARVYQRIGTDYYEIGKQALGRSQQDVAERAFPRALEFHTRSYSEAQKLRNMEPENAVAQRFLSVAFTNMANSLSANGKYNDALEMADKNLKLAEKGLLADKANKEANFDLSLANEVFANIYFSRKEYRSALHYRQKALAIEERMFAFDQSNREVQIRIAEHKRKIAEIQKLLG